MDHYFFEEKRGWAIPKKNPVQQTQLKKTPAMRAMGKSGTHAFHYSGPVFDFKKILCKLLPIKKIMHNLKVRKKNHAPENSPHPSPTPFLLPKHNGPSPCLFESFDLLTD